MNIKINNYTNCAHKSNATLTAQLHQICPSTERVLLSRGIPAIRQRMTRRREASCQASSLANARGDPQALARPRLVGHGSLHDALLRREE